MNAISNSEAVMPPEVVEKLAMEIGARLQAHLDRDTEQFDELRRSRLIALRLAVVALFVASLSLISNAILWRQVRSLHATSDDVPASAK